MFPTVVLARRFAVRSLSVTKLAGNKPRSESHASASSDLDRPLRRGGRGGSGDPFVVSPLSSLSGSRHLKHLQDKLNEMESARSVAVNLTYPSAKDASAPDGIGP